MYLIRFSRPIQHNGFIANCIGPFASIAEAQSYWMEHKFGKDGMPTSTVDVLASPIEGACASDDGDKQWDMFKSTCTHIMERD